SQDYLYGLLAPEIVNKNVESIVLALKGDDQNEIRAMQHFISEGAWDDLAILKQHWREVAVDLGEEEGVFTLDGSDFPKQGTDSVGVKRQHCGELGKTANCQAGDFLGYASSKGYTLLHRALYLPEDWIKDAAYAELRQKCGVPEAICFRTKPQLGLDMLQEVLTEGGLPGRWLACDEAFGRSPDFLDQVAGLGLWYYAEVPHDTRVWLERPRTHVPPWSGNGRKPTRERLVEGESEPHPVSHMAATRPTTDWTRYTIKEGSKGPLVADFAFLRVVAVRDELPGPQVWLILRRAVSSGELKIYVCNAPADTPHSTLVRISGMRWPIETSFEDGKQLIGLGDYQVRSWIGWHHHMTLCILAHFFLVRLKVRLRDKAPALTLPQAKLLLMGILPKREFDADWVLEVLGYRQRRNHAAYVSHRKRRLAELDNEVSL
ncbi:MAG: IS701 family transposase, partial [Anaerolineaceae bacterium]|nr:IS701 family transposase [Anaerolineaceae bacterium]